MARVRVVGGLALARAAGFSVGLVEGDAGALAALFSIAVLLTVVDFGFAFAVLSTVAAVFVARTRVVRRTLDAAAMRRSPFRNFKMEERGSPEQRLSGETIASHFSRYTEMMPEKRRAVN